MKKIKLYSELLRPKHYLKNALVLLPAFFGGMMLNIPTTLSAMLGFIAFSLFSSVVYIINDLFDAKRDCIHPEKKKRPIASGDVSIGEAICLVCVISPIAFGISLAASGLSAALAIPIVYVVLNIGYSTIFKHYPIIDIAVLVSGFFMRVLYGAAVTGITISAWMYLAVISVSFFLVIGKRRNEKKICGSGTRPVIEKYSENFLNMNMYSYLTLFLAFYAIWALQGDHSTPKLLTIPLVMLIMLRYSYLVEHENSHGDPVNVIIKDKIIIALGVLYRMSYLLFVFFEFLIFCMFIKPSDGNKILYHTTVASLLLIPLFKVGNSIDFVMRASIPALVVLCTYVISSLDDHIKNNRRLLALGLVAVVLLGAITAQSEISRAAVYTNAAEQSGASVTAEEITLIENGHRNNFFGEYQESFFFKVIAKTLTKK